MTYRYDVARLGVHERRRYAVVVLAPVSGLQRGAGGMKTLRPRTHTKNHCCRRRKGEMVLCDFLTVVTVTTSRSTQVEMFCDEPLFFGRPGNKGKGNDNALKKTQDGLPLRHDKCKEISP
jgi:hypothetical protein